MEGEEPDEGGRDVSVMYRSYCCENHVAPGVRLIEPETSFCDITARAPTLRSVVTRSPTPCDSLRGDLVQRLSSPPEAWGCRISPDRGALDEYDTAVLFQKTRLGAELRKLTLLRTDN